MERSSENIHYYESFSIAPPSFTLNLASAQPASEFHAKSSDGEGENLYRSTSNNIQSSEMLTDVNIHRIFDIYLYE